MKRFREIFKRDSFKGIRLSDKEIAVLALLENNGSLYGGMIAKLSDGLIKRGSVYFLLDKLVARGLIRDDYVETEEHDQNENDDVIPHFKDRYTITGIGQKALSIAKMVDVGYDDKELQALA